MPEVFGIDHRVFAVGTVALSMGVTAYAAYRVGRKHHDSKDHTTSKEEEESVYETQKSLQEYLIFHYGAADEMLTYDLNPKYALEFPRRCAELCMKHYKPHADVPSRALDIGCAVGRATFELTRQFREVVGIDYSHNFVKTCQDLKDGGELEYCVRTVGDITKQLKAKVDINLDRTRATFQQGDACALPADLGKFGCVLAANLICRLITPKDFLSQLSSLVTPGGVLVIMSPYTFLREFTPWENWIGGYRTVDGVEFTGFDGLRQCLEPRFELVEQVDMPFLIRETARKNQLTVSHATVWRRTIKVDV